MTTPAALAEEARHAALRSERDRFVAFAFAAADLLLEVSPDGMLRFATGAARGLTGRDAAELVGIDFLDLFEPADRAVAAETLRAIIRQGRAERIALRLAAPDGGTQTVLLSGCKVPDRNGPSYIALARAALAPATVADVPGQDRETGVLGTEAFKSSAIEALRAAQELGQDIHLTMVRLCGLEALRARAGSASVAKFFKEVGACLKAHAVDGQVAGRIGDEEYGVMVPEGSPELIGRLAGLARDAAPDGASLSVEERTVTLDARTLNPTDAAKALVYTIGRFATGKGEDFKIGALSEAFTEMVSDTVTRLSDLKSTILDSRFDVAFQPIVDLATREVHHYEMLARPDGNRSPAEMIRFAEGVGVIEQFDLLICSRAIEFLRSVQDPAPDVAVNLSGQSLQSAVFAKSLMSLLHANRAIHKRLLFEVTESHAITDLPRVDAVIQDIRALGHRVCLDDFGAGAASLAYVQAFSVDLLKIDGAYVTRLLANRRDQAILRAIVGLCKELGIVTAAEMVETEEQAHRLQELGVHLGQGYLFGRPARRPEVVAAKSNGAPARQVVRAGKRKGFVETWS